MALLKNSQPTSAFECMLENLSPLYRRTMTPDKRFSGSFYCRICHEDNNIEELIDPCQCSGSLGLIHRSCLEKWLSTSNTDRCEICKYVYTIQRKNKPFVQSFQQWWGTKSIHGPQGIAGDLVCLFVLTPLSIAATYLCGVGASAYMKLGIYEGTGLAILCCMLVVTYGLWLIVTIRFHLKSWQQWRKRNQDVKLIMKHTIENNNLCNVSQDSNNDTNNNNNNNEQQNRFTVWLFASSDNNNNHGNLCSVQQQEATIV